MKGTNVETMKGWSADERTVKLREWTQALFNLRLQKATGQLENTSRMQVVRRDAARVKTILTQKAAAAASADQQPDQKAEA